MALEGGVSHGYPKGAGGKAAASSSARSFLFSLCMLQRSPFNTTFLVMPLAELQNLRWFPIDGFPVLASQGHPRLLTHPSGPTELPDTPRLPSCSSLRLECRLTSSLAEILYI